MLLLLLLCCPVDVTATVAVVGTAAAAVADCSAALVGAAAVVATASAVVGKRSAPPPSGTPKPKKKAPKSSAPKATKNISPGHRVVEQHKLRSEGLDREHGRLGSATARAPQVRIAARESALLIQCPYRDIYFWPFLLLPPIVYIHCE